MFSRIPLAWLQITREKTRLLVAVAGVAFADVLMFIQLGFQSALFESITGPHRSLQADLVLINPQFENLLSGKSFSRDRLYQALGFNGVESVNPLYIATANWQNPQTRNSRVILVFGINPEKSIFNLPGVDQNLDKLKLLNQVLFDENSRPEFGPIAQEFKQEKTVETEVNEKQVKVSGLFTLGASFAADGNLITSSSTFMQILKDRAPEKIEIGLIKLIPGANAKIVLENLAAGLPKDVKVLTRESFAELEKNYWGNSTGIGFIFSLGAALGFIVGTVIVYQILYSDVSEHLAEYATLKAMGYTDRYLLVVIFQESLLLAALGYIPGFTISIGLYKLVKAATFLPMMMSVSQALLVLVLTVLMCSISGAIALRKLQEADPADIF